MVDTSRKLHQGVTDRPGVADALMIRWLVRSIAAAMAELRLSVRRKGEG